MAHRVNVEEGMPIAFCFDMRMRIMGSERRIALYSSGYSVA